MARGPRKTATGKRVPNGPARDGAAGGPGGRSRRESGGGSGGGSGGVRGLSWLSGLACGVLATVEPGLAALLGWLLAPAVLALWLDREPGRPMARTVLTCGLAGCVRPVMTLWGAGRSLETALAMAGDTATFGPAWMLAAGGWLACQLIPLAVRAALEAAAAARAAALRAERARLIEAWGLEEDAGEGPPPSG